MLRLRGRKSDCFGTSPLSIRSNHGGFGWTWVIVGIAALLPQVASAAPRIAVIGESSSGLFLCEFFVSEGYECHNFPDAGPDDTFLTYQIAIPLSNWSDPEHRLADFMRNGGGVITMSGFPITQGIDSDPTVQAWMGVNSSSPGVGLTRTVAIDPILGSLPIGTLLWGCSIVPCTAFDDTSGHSYAKVLARYGNGVAPIAMMRNYWEGGQSAYLGEFWPVYPLGEEIYLNTVRELTRAIPATSDWGLIALALLTLCAGTIVLTRRGRVCR